MSASAVSKTIFEIKANGDKTNIYISMLSGSVKNFLSFGSMDESAAPKSSGGGFTDYSSTRGLGGFKFES